MCTRTHTTHAHFHLRQDLIYDPEDEDDFSTLADEQGRLVLAAIQEEKRKK